MTMLACLLHLLLTRLDSEICRFMAAATDILSSDHAVVMT